VEAKEEAKAEAMLVVMAAVAAAVTTMMGARAAERAKGAESIRRSGVNVAMGAVVVATVATRPRQLYQFVNSLISLAHSQCKSLMKRSSRLSSVCLSVSPASDLQN